MRVTKYFSEYISAIMLGAVLIIAWYLSMLPFSLWLPGYSLLPEWLHDRSIMMLAGTYWMYIIIPACLIGIPICYYRVLKKL